MSNIAVIIDIWKYNFLKNKEYTNIVLAKNIINFLNSGVVDTAVLVSYDCNRELFSNKTWFKERSKQYSLLDLRNNKDSKQQTQDILLNYNNSNIHQLSMRHIEELRKILTDNDSVYMCGVSWSDCVQNRELGYINIKKHFSKIPILVDINTVWETDGTVPDMSKYPDWLNVSKDVYEYKPG